MIPNEWKLTGEEVFGLIDGDEFGGSYEDFIDHELPDRLFRVNDAAAKKAAVAALKFALAADFTEEIRAKLKEIEG